LQKVEAGRRKELKPPNKTANNRSMKTEPNRLYTAWKKLIRAYLTSVLVSLVIGRIVLKTGLIAPDRLFQASTQRISHAFPVFDLGLRAGIDLGVLLFIWNVLGALATMSFLYTAALFNPDQLGVPPRGLRKVFCGSRRMKLLCYLPGCSTIGVESLRRLYVWLMVPWLGIVLLGLESGLQVATAGEISGSFLSAAVSLVPHGLVEIPIFTLAGAVTFSGHLRIRETAQRNLTPTVFQELEAHRKAMPMKRIIWSVVGGLLLSGLVEGHVTPYLMGLV
jgi:hypothetical protein